MTFTKSIYKHLFVLLFVAFFALAFGPFYLSSTPVDAQGVPTNDILEFEGTYDWETTLDSKTSSTSYITYADLRDNYCTYTADYSTCESAVSGKYVRFDTAEELYRFSIDVSFAEVYDSGVPAQDYKLSNAKINLLLSLDYVLGNNIDYSVMQSKAFVPIGYAFTDVAENVYERSFNGTFDGQGFEIRNLYVAGYDHLIYIDQVDENTTIDIAMSEHYSMFNYNSGTITNVGLINPNLEILELHTDITKLSNLVGFNMSTGIVDNVYVIDNRSTVTTAGIRYAVGTSSEDFQAAGIIHTNQGTFTDAYYVSKVVVNGNYINKFDVQPVLFENDGGTISHLVYDSVVYLLQVTVGSSTFIIDTPNGLATGETTNTLKSTSSSLNNYSFTSSDISFTSSTGVIASSSLDFSIYHAGEIIWINGSLSNDGKYTITDSSANTITVSESLTDESAGESVTVSKEVWHFYPTDGYPLLQGFHYDSDNEVYLISNPVDFVFFARVIQFDSINHGLAYYASDYVITADLDMSILADDAYVIPADTFTGSLSGYNPLGTDNSDNFYIYNLTINQNIARGTEYYGGLFSVLGAGSEISNLNFSQSDVAFTDTEVIYSYTFYIGAIAGRMTGGTISNVLVDVDIDLGDEAIGKTYAGGIVGKASGVIEYTSNNGNIYVNEHAFSSSYSIKATYNIGGIVGAAESVKLTLTDVVNHGDIYGFETSSDITLATGYTQITIRIGGVIGYIYNIANNLIEMVNVANHGDIYLQSVKKTISVPSYQNVGGVFGILEGLAPDLESNDEYLFANLYNSGDIHHTYVTDTATIRSAGIGVSNPSAVTEYALLFNHGTFDFTEGSATYSQTQFTFIPLIYDIGSYSITLSRSYNYGDMVFDSNVYHDTYGIIYSASDNVMTLNFVANYGNIEYFSNSGQTQLSLSTDLYITGITRNTHVQYLNVYNFGTIDLVNINAGSNDIYIAGISTILADGKYIKNSLNDGDITFAQISGTGNIYVGGLVNINFSGDLEDVEQSPTQPVATIGIINSLNSGNITTSYGTEGDGLYGIDGTNNTFIGGMVTLNRGSIQNSSNLGNISAYNSNTGGVANWETATYYAGLIINYTAGIVAGGIVGATIDGDARVYDTANNGDILVITYEYSRAGGILGTSLYDEAEGGGITAGMGLENDIEDSVLSNGLNFGNISALTTVIGTYQTGSTYQQFYVYHNGSTSSSAYEYFETTYGTDDRPQINASAGGVIGYGLSVMKNMLNHGTISSTDVAGGIVGATYALGSSSGSYYTTVNITTAINYGDVKAILTSSLGSINRFDLDFTDVESVYLSDGNTFIFPTESSREMPGSKRGFGGIFGRLQRGTDGVMTSEGDGTFDFIVNANPNIDLIGRLDQVMNFSSSSRYFRFNDAIYYSAKLDDTTQVVFTGYYYTYARIVSRSGYNPYVYTATANQVYEQIGVESNYMGNYGETFYFYSRTSYSNGRSYYTYFRPLTIPWITEDPSDPNLTNLDTEYIYDSDFPMRTDPNLTEYIYFMDNDLLAPRFTSVRPNGMYVLSTSAGQSFGSVIPKNIDMSYIRMIDEDYSGQISLDIDYNVISPAMKTEFGSSIENGYLNLRQTTFNDKAELIPSDTVYVTIEEDDGSNTILSNPDVDYINNTVTFSISMEAFNVSQTTASYSITTALISSYGLIAIRPDDYFGHAPSVAELQTLRADLYDEKNNVISTEDPPDLTVTLPSHDITNNVTYSIGYFSVYSEAFIGDNLYATTEYYNDYQVYIEFTPTLDLLPGTTQIEDVQFNGGSIIAVTDPTDVTALGDVNSMGSITLYFEDNKGVLTQGYDFKNNFVVKFNDGTVVNSSYYTVTSNPVDISGGIGYFDITFTFIGATISGDYYFSYSYFPTSTVYTCDFDKDPSSSSSILDFTYYSEQDSITYNGYVITSYANMGTEIDMDSSLYNFTSSTGSNPSYMSNVTYDIDFMTPGTLQISPFAEIVEATLISTTITDGYKTYQMEYIVQAEDGSTQSVYTHYLTERTVDLVSVLKDGNDVELDSIETTREALLTEFTINLGLDPNLDLYILDSENYYGFEVSVVGTTNDGLTTYDPSEIVGITYSVDDLFYLDMTYETLPGIYTFSFVYYRDGSSTDYITFETDLVIEKNLGTNAYLSDIKFSELANETTYPDIYIADLNGDPTSSSYSPAIYFEGIDYDGADEAGYPYYRVDGKVSNVPLDTYVPYFLDYLPFGATISRYAYDTNTTSWYWTDEVSDASSPAVDDLVANYTQDPITGYDDNVVIEFRVTAEDGVTQVYYFITVTDVTYNLSIVFDIYYCSTPSTCVLANQSQDFNDQLVIIDVMNLSTNGDDMVFGVTDPDDYPTFTEYYGPNNRIVQLYDTGATEYQYKFGRNMAGFYSFNVILPVDQYLNDLYTYEIEYEEYYLYDVTEYNTSITDLQGKYYYIEYAISNRTRRFNIYISPISSPETGVPYGLFDFFKSWFTE